jgi:hypothetical protein
MRASARALPVSLGVGLRHRLRAGLAHEQAKLARLDRRALRERLDALREIAGDQLGVVHVVNSHESDGDPRPPGESLYVDAERFRGLDACSV